MNTHPRNIKSIEANQNITFTESVNVSGDIGENAKLIVHGDLVVEGTVNPGAFVTATGNIKVKQAFGSDTCIRSDKSIQIGLVTDDVQLISSQTRIGVRMPVDSAIDLGLRPPLHKNQNNFSSFKNS